MRRYRGREEEPFDFLTVFDFALTDEPACDVTLAAMRAGQEENYVEWEVSIWL